VRRLPQARRINAAQHAQRIEGVAVIGVGRDGRFVAPTPDERRREYGHGAHDHGVMAEAGLGAQPGRRHAEAVDHREPVRGRQELGQALEGAGAGEAQSRADFGFGDGARGSQRPQPGRDALEARSSPASRPTNSPAMISSPFSPSTWLRTVSAAGTPSRPIGVFRS
jgi:hypothetical protein